MKKMLRSAVFAFICVGVWAPYISAKLEQKNIENGIAFGVHRRLIMDVSDALYNRWTPMQRASIAGVSFPDTSIPATVAVQPVNQGANPELFQENFSSMVSDIVNRLENVVGARQYERLDVLPTGANGVTFRPVFLRDFFDSSEDEEDEVIPDISASIAEPTTLVTPVIQSIIQPIIQPTINKDEMVLDSETEDSDFDGDDEQEDDEQDYQYDQDSQDSVEFDFEPAPER